MRFQIVHNGSRYETDDAGHAEDNALEMGEGTVMVDRERRQSPLPGAVWSWVVKGGRLEDFKWHPGTVELGEWIAVRIVERARRR